jgi:hypothetical protein
LSGLTTSWSKKAHDIVESLIAQRAHDIVELIAERLVLVERRSHVAGLIVGG